MLRQVRTVLLRAEAGAKAINEQCKPVASLCTSLYAFDFFVHSDFTSTVLEVNARPIVPHIYRQPGASDNMVAGYLRLSGAAGGSREPYLPAFRAVAWEMCLTSPQQCTRRRLRDMLQLSDTQWGLGVVGWRLLFPPDAGPMAMGLDPQTVLDCGPEGVAEVQWTQEFLRRMHRWGNGTLTLPPVDMQQYMLQDLVGHVLRWSAASGRWEVALRTGPKHGPGGDRGG